MAQRRMFSKTVTDSARFLRMPMEARLLYYDLGMAADDDGCVEGYTVLLKTGGREEHLRLLEGKGFLKILNEDLVVYLLDWSENNRIRKDRYHKSAYWSLVEEILGPQAKPEEKDGPRTGDGQAVTECQPDDNRNSTNPQPNDNQTVTDCEPSDNRLPTEVRLGKDRLGKDRLGKSSLGQDSIGQTRPGEARPFGGAWSDGTDRVNYGPYNNVELSLDEVIDLTNRLPGFDDKLKRFSAYLKKNGNHPESCYRAMLDWANSG